MIDRAAEEVDGPGAVTGPAGGSAGTMLRQAREAAGLHIGALSVALKVPVRKLEALEADQLDLLPDAVFARALASSVCRNLKIDPAPILARLPGQVMPDLQLDSSTSDRTSLHSPRALWNISMLARIPTPVLVVAALLLLAAVVLFFMPDRALSPSDTVSSVSGPATVATTTDTVTQPVAVAVAAIPELGASAAAALPVPVAPPAVQAPAPAAAPDNSLLLLRASSTAWVEVVDAAGTPLLRKTLGAGESAALSGRLPLSVVVGRADAIEVQVRGQAFDLGSLAKDNVARFQVK